MHTVKVTSGLTIDLPALGCSLERQDLGTARRAARSVRCQTTCASFQRGKVFLADETPQSELTASFHGFTGCPPKITSRGS